MNKYKIHSIFFIFLFLFIILLLSFLHFISNKPAKYINPITYKKFSAIRGDIITDNFALAKSKRVYYVYINPNNIKVYKRNLFIDIFSIYTNQDKEKIKKLIYNSSKRVLLAKIDLQTKHFLTYLNRVLAFKYKIFKPNKYGNIIGLEIEEAPVAFNRIYPYNDLFEPFLGRYRKDKKRGDNGLEKYYEEYLKEKKDGYIKGYRDAISRIIYDKKAVIKYPENGATIELNINLTLQNKIEKLIDKYKKESNATEVIAAIMKSDSGKIISIATSNRYNPNNIKKEDIKNMKINAIRYLYEPGSIMKPIILAILLENRKVNLLEPIKAYNGRWKPKWRKKAIKDDTPFAWLTPENAIVYSSNIVISQLALRLDIGEYYNGLLNFGLSEKSGIDLPYEIKGKIRPPYLLKYPIFASTTAYGYGIQLNFMEILRAFNTFNNNGILIDPKIANVHTKKRMAISSTTAAQMLNVLRKVVLKGTARKAYFKDIFTAGKTGTAHVSIKGKYQDIYNSSFFGFANDRNNKYTIGITFFNIKSNRYFASQTAVPLFRDIVNILKNEKLLIGENKE